MAKQNLSQHLASLGDLFMQTWEIIKKEWKNLLITSLFGVAIGFIGIILMWIATAIALASGSGAIASIVILLFTIIAIVAIIIVYSYITIVVTKITKAALENKPVEIKKLLMDTLNVEKIKPVATTGLLDGVMSTLWSLLLIIPGLRKGVQWTFATIISATTGKSNREALKESEKLVKDRRWMTFGYVLAGGLVISIICGILSGIFNDTIGSLIGNIISVAFIVFLVLMYFQRSKTAPATKASKKEEKAE